MKKDTSLPNGSFLIINDYIFPSRSGEKPENYPKVHKIQIFEIL